MIVSSQSPNRLPTFFQILTNATDERCKYIQVSFLHVYHHSTMPFVFWFGANFAPGGNSVFGSAQNSAVHVIMYTYYFLASFGSKYRKYLWWKKYLTLLQLTQFTINLVFLINFLVNPGMCDFPHWMPKFMVFYMISFIVLFGNFYLFSYIKAKSSSSVKPKSNGSAPHGKMNLNGTAANGSATNGTLTNGTLASEKMANGTTANGRAINGSSKKTD